MLVDDILDDFRQELPEGDDIFYPGEFDKDIADSLKELTESLQSLQNQLNESSAASKKQFYVNAVLTLLALTAAVISAFAAVIQLL